MGTKRLLAVVAMAFAMSGLGPRSPVMRADARQATCWATGWEWKKNSLGQDPCGVVSMLEASCRGVDSYPIRWLGNSDDTYYPPGGSQQDTTPTSTPLSGSPNPSSVYSTSSPAPSPNAKRSVVSRDVNTTADLACECDTVTYSLYMSCTACQGGRVYSWRNWIIHCGSVQVAQYPHTIPQGTAIPRWALYDVTSIQNQTYSDSLAMSIGRDPEATPSPLPQSPGHKSNTGAIAGGVVGGVVLIVLALVAAFFIKRRRGGKGDDTPYGQEVPVYFKEQQTAPNLSPTSQDFLHTSYYNPDDPTTFPPSMSEIQGTLPNVQNPQGQGRGPRPGVPGM